MPRRIHVGGDGRKSKDSENSVHERENGKTENVGARRVLDKKTLSFIQRLIQTNVPKRIQKEELFVTLKFNETTPTSTSMDEKGDGNQKDQKKDDQLTPTEDVHESPSSPIRTTDSAESDRPNRQGKRRPMAGAEDLRQVLNRQRIIKADGESRTGRDPTNVNTEASSSIGSGDGGSLAKRFRPSPEPDTSESESSEPHKVKSEISVVRNVRRRSSSSSEEEPDVGLDKKKPSQRSARSEPSSSNQRHRSRILKSEGEESPSSRYRSPGPSNEERFTFFFTKKFVFSNHYPCIFTVGDQEYTCTEQYYMYKKAVHFGDLEKAKQIMSTSDPSRIKRLGASSYIRGFDREEWDKEEVGRRYMREANLAKYQQNADLRAELLKTCGTTLVEANPHDPKWGIGLSLTDPQRLRRRTWRGQNWLGQILTEIRDKLVETDGGDSD